ncbi:MAG: hypothetical protein AAGA21_24560 [Pseudomonadota bacterium]
MSTDVLITIIAHALALMTFVPVFCAIIWGMFQVIRFNSIVLEIHATVSKKPYANLSAMANFFDDRVLDQREKRLRAEGMTILSRIMLLFMIGGPLIAGLVILTSN